jgi:hypothetical protein
LAVEKIKWVEEAASKGKKETAQKDGRDGKTQEEIRQTT